MSKIAEQKALEAFPQILPPYNTNIEAETNVIHAFNREGYIKGYDCAMQDFLEKAVEWLRKNKDKYIRIKSMKILVDDSMIEDFKKVMKGE